MPSQYIPKRITSYDVKEAMTVVDYGCGSGRFSAYFSSRVGENGNVYAVDNSPVAIKNIEKMITSKKLTNIVPVLAKNNLCGLQDRVADRIFAIDMFHLIDNPTQFLSELYRIIKRDGILFLEYGHQTKKEALEKVAKADVFQMCEAQSKYIMCKPK